MVWLDFKKLVRSKVSFSESSFADLSTLTYGNATDREMWRYFQDFIQRSREIHVPVAELTLLAGDQYIDLLDPAKSSDPLWYIDNLWSGSVPIQTFAYSQFTSYFPSSSTSFSTAGTPRAWTMIDGDEGKIVLNVPLNAAAAAATTRASGFSLHPPLTVGAEDATELTISRLAIDPAAEYIAVQLAKPVVNEQAEAGRITNYAKNAEAWIRTRRAKQRLKLANPRLIDEQPYGYNVGQNSYGWR